MPNMDETMMFRKPDKEINVAARVIHGACQAMEAKGYDPISQFVGYLLSGDPTYITSHDGARSKVRSLERDELLEELVRAYIKK
jgi:uncharacterized protein (UPF0297 family)